MSILAIPNIECIESSNNYGHYSVEPLEKGFGTTLGNAMRRVLLGYLPGAAVTQVRIEGIQHEFSPIPHVKEDVLEFLLNVRALRLKPLSGQPGRLTLEKDGMAEVHAADIKPSTDFEIANPELYLATLDSPQARLYVEFDVELGTGYRPAEAGNNLPLGTIPVDAIFTPMRKVNIAIEPVRVGQKASHERLSLEVWTDGTITAANAISSGAAILLEQLTPLVDYGRVSMIDEEKKKRALRASISEAVFNMPVEQLELSVRVMNCLRHSGINTVGELISKSEKELMALRNFGQKSKQEIDERLRALGVSFSLAAEEAEPQPNKKSSRSKSTGQAVA